MSSAQTRICDQTKSLVLVPKLKGCDPGQNLVSLSEMKAVTRQEVLSFLTSA